MFPFVYFRLNIIFYLESHSPSICIVLFICSLPLIPISYMNVSLVKERTNERERKKKKLQNSIRDSCHRRPYMMRSYLIAYAATVPTNTHKMLQSQRRMPTTTNNKEKIQTAMSRLHLHLYTVHIVRSLYCLLE